MDVALTSGLRAQVLAKRLNLFERYLTIWVGVCMVVGVLLGQSAPSVVQWLRSWEFGEGSHVNAPIAVLIWFMIIPVMMRIDVASIRHVGKKPMGLLVTLFVNWIVKPFSMAFFAWVFFQFVFSAWIAPSEADQYIAGTIILGAAPCTAMVFVWSYLTDGDPAYTLVQVSMNDLIMLVLFAPIVGFLVTGASALTVPLPVLFYSVLAFIVIPLIIGVVLRHWFIAQQGKACFEDRVLPRFAPITIVALLAMLVLLFAFQADNITGKTWHVALIAVPILIQVYFNASLAYLLMKWLHVPHSVAAPATVVGVLVEVPVMLSVCAFCNRTRTWFPAEQSA
jgi:arsenite transporter